MIRAGIIDGHEAVRIGLAAAVARESHSHQRLVMTATASTVDAFLGAGADICDVVALDLSLADGSNPGDNVRRLVAAGYKVLIFTISEDVGSLLLALGSGAMGVSWKSEPVGEILSKLRSVAAGEFIQNQEPAAAIETASQFAVNRPERTKEHAPGWSTYAKEDLRAIGDSSVVADILDIGNKDLRPHANDALEGPLDNVKNGRFRRCVWAFGLAGYLSFDLDDVDEFRNQACNYALIYRDLTRAERINQRLEPGLVIVRVVSNEEIRILMRNRLDG